MKYEHCIVGAGLSGITLAKALGPNTIILEKSRGLGGRVAARRFGPYSINHGLLELVINQEKIQDPHSWLKSTAKDLNIQREWEVLSFHFNQEGITIQSKDGKEILTNNLILSAPAPQTQAILKRSGIDEDFLHSVRYRPEIQLLTYAPKSRALPYYSDWFYLKHEIETQSGHSLKLLALKDFYLEGFLEADNETIKDFFLERFGRSEIELHVHKWRYAEALSSIDRAHQTHFAKKKVFLVGDYFTATGASSAIDSAQFLANNLHKTY